MSETILNKEQKRDLDCLLHYTILPGIKEDVVRYEVDPDDDEFYDQQEEEAIRYLIELLKGALG